MFGNSWHIGRIFGIPLRVHISWFLVFALVAWQGRSYFPVRAAAVPLLGILDNGDRGCLVAVCLGPGARAGPLSRCTPVPDPDRPDHPVHLRWDGADPARSADAEGGVPDRDRGADRVGRGRRRLLAVRRVAGGAARGDRRLGAPAEHQLDAGDVQSRTRLSTGRGT